jgi:hypothetical protein
LRIFFNPLLWATAPIFPLYVPPFPNLIFLTPGITPPPPPPEKIPRYATASARGVKFFVMVTVGKNRGIFSLVEGGSVLCGTAGKIVVFFFLYPDLQPYGQQTVW